MPTTMGARAGVAALVCLFMMTWPASDAQASQCASFSADSGNNTIILGEATSYFWYEGQKVYSGLGYLSICWLDSIGAPVYDTFSGSCDTSSTSTDWISVNALAGDDIVWPNDQTTNDCNLGNRMWPFDENVFDFYVLAFMGTGADTAYGTEHADVLYSNTGGSFPNLYPADSAEDILCGYGGADDLRGDNDDTETFEEILHGGAGTGDYCYGGLDGDVFDWAHTSCETIDNASSTGVDRGNCGDFPPYQWWF